MKRPTGMIPLRLIQSSKGRVGVLFIFSHIEEDRKCRNERKSRQKAKGKQEPKPQWDESMGLLREKFLNLNEKENDHGTN